ncbi:MAG: CDP-glycerol glycerophosphotransferase family protein [Syntrophorhabdaceae bacterium]|nr:CDP-glycerol glycerophosphotransferase family protein [Syntrophorhabdaceae bacterium]
MPRLASGKNHKNRHRSNTQKIKPDHLTLNSETYEALEKQLRNYNEQSLRTYINTVNLQHDLRRIPLRTGEKIRAHFLYFCDFYWSSWNSFYQACLADERFDTKIVFLERKEGELPQYPPSDHAKTYLETYNIPYVTYDAYDPYAEKPHFLIYQFPYNGVYLHFAKVKTNFIRQHGIRPVYISYGIEYDKPRTNPDLPDAHLNMMHYRQYVQLFAWKIFVMHPDIREGFFTHCLAGGAHVSALGSPKFDAYAAKEALRLPKTLLHKAAGRPILAWQVHHFWTDGISDPGRTHSPPFAELERMFAWLQEQNHIFTVVTLHPLFVRDALRLRLATHGDIDRVKNFIQQSPNMTLYDGPYQPLLAMANAFVTEKSSLMFEMAFLNKPVLLLQDLEVALKPFAADIASAFYHGRGLDDVKKFFRILENPEPDMMADTRKRVWARYFSGYDGHIGERIKNSLVENLLTENKSAVFYRNEE